MTTRTPVIKKLSHLNAEIKTFLSDCEKIGPVRFVLIGSGAILETLGSFSNLRYSETAKGSLATLSTDDPCFECHIRLTEIKHINMIETKKKIGDEERLIRVARFLGGDGTSLLSAILHGETHINQWIEIRKKYGDSIAVDMN